MIKAQTMPYSCPVGQEYKNIYSPYYSIT